MTEQSDIIIRRLTFDVGCSMFILFNPSPAAHQLLTEEYRADW